MSPNNRHGRYKYAVTFYFRFANLTRVVRAECVADAIKKAGRQVFELNMRYEAVIAQPI
jgi:hypothetical protein